MIRRDTETNDPERKENYDRGNNKIERQRNAQKTMLKVY